MQTLYGTIERGGGRGRSEESESRRHGEREQTARLKRKRMTIAIKVRGKVKSSDQLAGTFAPSKIPMAVLICHTLQSVRPVPRKYQCLGAITGASSSSWR